MFHVRVEQADHSVYLLKPPSHLWPYPGLERGALASAFVVRLVSDFEAVTGSVCRLQSPLLFEKRYWLQNGAHEKYVKHVPQVSWFLHDFLETTYYW